MPDYVKEYEFKNRPKEINYYDDKPLELSSEFSFYHNKSLFRKELNRLQYLFRNYLKTSLIAAGIRDSYLKEEFTEKFLIILFTTSKIIKDTNRIIEAHSVMEIPSGCFYLESNSEYLLILTKDMDGLNAGIDTLEEILTQTFKDYFNRKKFEEYIKIRPFNMISCAKSS
ncbi:MAG: hypothetical protein ACFFAH_12210 [Promethearchaeota archaeon]